VHKLNGSSNCLPAEARASKPTTLAHVPQKQRHVLGLPHLVRYGKQHSLALGGGSAWRAHANTCRK
jgi:hypothetical protein